MEIRNEMELFNLFIEKVRIGAVSKSPYSSSYYICETEEDTNKIGWSSKPDNHYRISDHWNFWSEGELHCIIKNSSYKAIQKTMLAKWDHKTSTYEKMFEIDLKEIISLFIKLENNRVFKDIIEKENFFEGKNIKFKKMEIENIDYSNIKKVFEYEAYLQEKYLDKLNEKRKKERLEELEKVAKNNKKREELLQYLEKEELFMHIKEGAKIKQSTEYKKFVKFQKLFLKIKKENVAPRGGKIGEKLIFDKKENKFLIKKINEFVK